MRNDVFVSYPRAHQRAAHALAEALRARGLRVWIDYQQIGGGDRWWHTIVAAIADSDAVVYLDCPEFRTSEVCQAELGYARQLGRTTIPVEAPADWFWIGIPGLRHTFRKPQRQPDVEQAATSVVALVRRPVAASLATHPPAGRTTGSGPWPPPAWTPPVPDLGPLARGERHQPWQPLVVILYCVYGLMIPLIPLGVWALNRDRPTRRRQLRYVVITGWIGTAYYAIALLIALAR